MAHMSKKGDWFVARFTWDGKEYKKSLKTKDSGDAKAALREVENRLHDLHRGKVAIPPGVDSGDFIVWGNGAQRKGEPRAAAPTFVELTNAYLLAQKGFKAESTVTTEGIHLKTAAAALGRLANAPVDQLRHRDLVAVLQTRLQQVTDTTVKKERQTIIALFAWAVQQEILDSSPAAGLPPIKADRDRPPFRTFEEVEEMLGQGGLNDAQAVELWECLYLTSAEIGEILGLAKSADEGFAYPMFALIAYTGIRRGEMLRLRWIDVDFRRGLVTARSLKQSRQKRETSRHIDLHPELASILEQFRRKRPKGQYVLGVGKSLAPLTKSQANEAFRRVLRGTRWEQTMPSGRKKIIIGFHTFRHGFASNLAVQGIDQRIIDQWMGHTTEAMRRRYQHLFPQKLAESIRVLSYGPPISA
ncbi:MAG: site-specific integrase [Planctomycetota bacterium]